MKIHFRFFHHKLNSQNIKKKKESYRVSLPIQPTLEFYSLKKNCDDPAYQMVPGAISMSLICLWQRYFTLCTENVINTSIHSRMAVFKGMHVSPAKHNDGKGVKMTSRKCDYRTYTQADRQTDIGRSCSYVPLCFAGKAIKWH